MLFFELNYFTLTLFLGGIIAIFSSTIVYLSNPKSEVNKNWFLSNLFAAVWSFGYLTMISTNSQKIAEISNIILHASAIYVPLFYFVFVLHLTNFWGKQKRIMYGLFVLSIIFLILNFSKYFVSDVFPKYIFNFAPDAGPVYIYFAIYFFAIVAYSLILVYRRVREARDPKFKKTLLYTLIASSFGFAGGGSVFFLTFNILFPPFPLILFALYPIVISYAVIRHQLFNVKVIATELFVLILWIFLLVRFVVANNITDRIIDGSVFLGTMIIGTLVIKSVLKEVDTRERIEGLAEELATANDRLRELDRLKSEFVSIASHQLRSPLTAMKGYSSMLLEGSFGKVPERAREAIDKIYQSSERLVIIIEDFLNISRIEQGRMKYEFTSVELDELVEEVVEELMPHAKEAGLKISIKEKSDGPFKITADRGKIQQVLGNLIDNAIKYTPKGSITISIDKDEETRKILLSIKDTGIGIPKDIIPHLFQKFNRGSKEAGKTNIKGTGLGLYVAKEIVKAHHGNIWVDSDGLGKGTTFYLNFMAE